MTKKLTDKEEAFCQAYVNDAETRWNKTQSAIKAGYSEKSAKELGYDTYTKDHVKARISELSKVSMDTNEELVKRVVEEYKELAFVDIKDFVDEKGNFKPIKEIDNTRAINQVVVRNIGSGDSMVTETLYKLHDKTQILKGLSSYLGMDKIDITSGGEKLPSKIEIEFVSTKSDK